MMNIETVKAYLETVHMNRKVAKYLIQLIEDLQELDSRPTPTDTLFTKKYNAGCRAVSAELHNILSKEV